jgi:hypothetical protein
MKARLLVVLSLVTGCSVYMEATRPAPVDLSKFQLGEERYSVIEQLGAPETTEASGANSCDLYRLYTTGHGTFRKVATIVGEGATDVVFPPAEILWSGGQAATRDKKTPVWFCYKNKKLLSASAGSDPSFTRRPVPTSTETPPAPTTTPAATPTPLREGLEERFPDRWASSAFGEVATRGDGQHFWYHSSKRQSFQQWLAADELRIPATG